MIVCVCKAISERLIKQAVDEGAKTFEDLQIDLGVSVQCGKCETCVRRLVGECEADAGSSVVAPQQNEEQPIFMLKRA